MRIFSVVDDSPYRKHRAEHLPYEADHPWHDYAPAYRIGTAARKKFPDHSFEESEAQMEVGYAEACGDSRLDWDRAHHAAPAAFDAEYPD